jgi:hypothetical protein
MWPHRNACMGLLTVQLGLANACQSLSVGQQRLALLTPEEAGQLQLTDEEWQLAPRMRALPSGPRPTGIFSQTILRREKFLRPILVNEASPRFPKVMRRVWHHVIFRTH